MGGFKGRGLSDFRNVLKVIIFQVVLCSQPRIFMCCVYGVRLFSRQTFFWPPLSEFSGAAPAWVFAHTW